MSVGIVTVCASPEPVFHSPKAIVWLDPSWMSRSPNGRPVTWNSPLGGPPATPACHSMPDPYDAK